ncbi:hypothetical protein EKL30_01000 [Candidimonas sp. SYP-B2681]|uniref:hypothetical protein n=1 Tax=Candidimonas sp. SYP-B2681 TaxID=2497686 RepID=UPI000F875B88|nr:hypothetical protein [Candidimonas sp. SYP-B2681]RTZ47615.1 hypothetical protein EKL30_01000 [Candidimonas sp. SYP-B2681]
MERQEESIRLGFESCEDMLAKLEREGARLLKSHQADDVMNFRMTGHHLVQDWVREVGTDAMRKRRDMISGEAKTVVQILYDVSNGSKHFRLTRKAAKPAVYWRRAMLSQSMIGGIISLRLSSTMKHAISV